MCFAPQRRALFRHLNLQKWREHVVFCTFWLGNVLRATTACTFSTSEPPKVARTCGVLHILTWKCASRHNCVHFFDIRTSKSGPNLVCFVHFELEMCFAATTACTFSTSQLPKVVSLTWKCASRHNGVHFFISHLASWLRTAPAALASLKTTKKHSVSRLSYLFTHLHLLSSDLFSSTLLSSNLSLLSASSLLCFSSVHIPYCWKFDF